MIAVGLLVTDEGVIRLDLFADDNSSHREMMERQIHLLPAIQELHKKAREQHSGKA